MKLLSLKIGQMEKSFRSLYSGFEINFHSLSDDEGMQEFRPFCFAGLNGSGKSNVLEALANIFYHLEICVARYLPDSIRNRKNFKREVCSPDAFTLEYLIGQHDGSAYVLANFVKVTISKKVGEEPKMEIRKYPFNQKKGQNISLIPDLKFDIETPAKSYLPDHIIGYSSGENEILSLPFIKARLVHLDEFKQYTKNNVAHYDEPENGLIYIDNAMSQAVLLSCLLLENKEALKPLNTEIGIECLESFRMHINLKNFKYHIKAETGTKTEEKPVLTILENDQLDKFKRCATSWFINKERLVLDFYVGNDDEKGYNTTKEAFRTHFEDSSLKLFQAFRLLYELNNHFLEDSTKEEVYRSQGYYTDGKIPTGGPNDDVFHFLDFMIIKKMKGSGEEKSLLLRNFSDGEHQLLHTMGICLLLKAKRAILLLDEPETHFNPSWRAKFIKMLNDSISAGNKKDYVNGSFNVHYLKDILLTSHSPFVISDCLPNNVIFFDKDEETHQLRVRKASEMGINTYGAGVDFILEKMFDFDQSIGDESLSKLELDYSKIKTKEDVQSAKDIISRLGESIEKDLVLAKLNQISRNINNPN